MTPAPPVFHSTSRRRFLVRSAISVAALGISPGAYADKSEAPLRVAQAKGRFDFEALFGAAGVTAPPYPVAYSEFAVGNLVVEAMNAGALDFGGMSEVSPIFIAANNPQLKIVAVFKGDVNTQVILIPHESTIGSVADLKGKRVGYVRGTGGHYFLIKILAELGLTLRDITPVNLSPADGQAAFVSGAIDAWAIYGHFGPLAVHNHGARVLKTALGYLSGNYLLAAHPEAIADPVRHAEIGDFLLRLRRAYGWLNSNPETWAPIEAKALGLPPDIILEELRNQSAPTQILAGNAASIKSQQEVADVFFTVGLLPKPIDVTPLWDHSFSTLLLEN